MIRREITKDHQLPFSLSLREKEINKITGVRGNKKSDRQDQDLPSRYKACQAPGSRSAIVLDKDLSTYNGHHNDPESQH